ncbi:MAG: hypothetical protein ABR530_08075 [Pyrinomonadaceae bacterium]
MAIFYKLTVTVLMMMSLLALGCATADEPGSKQPVNTTSEPAKTNRASATPGDDGTIPSGTGVEKATPAAGKANVQGKALFNDKPAVGVEVRLCRKFSQFLGGCSGETFTAKTDEAGEYLIADVSPGMYEGLTIQVFDTPYYVFATSGFVSSAKYNIEEGKTYFAPDTHLFKNDLKLLNPKAGSKVPGENIEVKWEPYPDAAYYKLSIHADTSTSAVTEYDYIGKRVDGVSVVLDKTLGPGTYTCKVEAYGGNNRRLSQSASDIKFTVTK